MTTLDENGTQKFRNRIITKSTRIVIADENRLGPWFISVSSCGGRQSNRLVLALYTIANKGWRFFCICIYLLLLWDKVEWLGRREDSLSHCDLLNWVVDWLVRYSLTLLWMLSHFIAYVYLLHSSPCRDVLFYNSRDGCDSKHTSGMDNEQQVIEKGELHWGRWYNCYIFSDLLSSSMIVEWEGGSPQNNGRWVGKTCNYELRLGRAVVNPREDKHMEGRKVRLFTEFANGWLFINFPQTQWGCWCNGVFRIRGGQRFCFVLP